MIRLHAFLKAVIVSSAAAPLLFYWSVLAAWQLMGEPAWNRSDGFQAGGPMVLPLLSLYYGLLIALVPNLIGTVLLSSLGGQHGWARSPFAWAAAGAVPALILTVALAMPAEVPVLAFATFVTSVGSALVFRAFIRWRRPAQAGRSAQAKRSTTSASGMTARRSGVR